MLELETFKTVVASTPLISLDLIVRNSDKEILLGLRNNRPAQGFWFVPGGRVLKDEFMAAAFARLTVGELGIECPIDSANFLGPYEHFYSDNFSGNDFSTHYVVLGYELTLELELQTLPDKQHCHYRWFGIDELLVSDQVHQHTKDYF